LKLFLWNVLRVYSWIFQAVLSLMAIAVAVVAYVTGVGALDIPWIVFHVPQNNWLISLGLIGLFCVVLAAKGTLRILLFLFAIHSLYMLVKGLFMSGYSFAGPNDFRNAVILTVAAFLSVIGAWPSSNSRAR
jgi:hypothetical protein